MILDIIENCGQILHSPRNQKPC